MRARQAALAAVVSAALLASACASSGPSSSGGTLEVVAAESFWGSLAAQLGGRRVHVTSIITNPGTDPHDYEPTTADARALASAGVVIVNGVGYDSWASKAIDANPTRGRVVLNVGDVVGVKEGDNPHRWYFPGDVDKVIDRITADYKRVDPRDASYFDQQHDQLESTGLAQYHQLLATITRRFAGTPVGASESIFVGIAAATSLRLLTPPAYLTAISEGTEPTARDKATADAQISEHTIKAFVFNRQNSTPDVQRLVNAARSNGIPVATVTETLSPAGLTFEAWQSHELEDLEHALAAATGR